MCGCGTEEKTSSAKGIVRINYKEDFELVVELLAGDKPYKLGDEDFRIDFIVMASRYTVGRTAGVCERCAVDGNKIRCFMDGHGLPPGELRAEVKVNTPDPNYADGKRLNVAIAEGVVLLVKDNTRFDGAVIKAAMSMMLVDAYQLANEHGYKGTIDEYYDTFTEVGHLKENIKVTIDKMTKAEKQRSTAETERAKAATERDKAETQRQTDEELRNQAETERASAEGKRIKAEKKRSTTFSSMQENINSKIKDVNAATSDLKSIIGMDKGVFASIDALQTDYPSPQVGFSAKVGTELPYAIYVCEKTGTWKDSGAKYTPTTQVPTVKQTTGESETSVMSQKAVTEKIQTEDGKYLQEVYAKTLAIHDASFDGTRYKDFQTCLASIDTSLTEFEKKHIKKVICLLEDGTWCEMNRMSAEWSMDTDSWEQSVNSSGVFFEDKIEIAKTPFKAEEIQQTEIAKNYYVLVNKLDYVGTCYGMVAYASFDGYTNIVLIDTAGAKTLTYIKKYVHVVKGKNVIVLDSPIEISAGQYIGFRSVETFINPIIGTYGGTLTRRYYNDNFGEISGCGAYNIITKYEKNITLPEKVDVVNDMGSSKRKAISQDFISKLLIDVTKTYKSDNYVEDESLLNGNTLSWGIIYLKYFDHPVTLKSLTFASDYRGNAKIGVIYKNASKGTYTVEQLYDIEITDKNTYLLDKNIILPMNRYIAFFTLARAAIRIDNKLTSENFMQVQNATQKIAVGVNVRGGRCKTVNVQFEFADIEFTKDNALKNCITPMNSCKVLFTGSSLTDCHYFPRGLSWIERLNDLTDINITNNGSSGGNISRDLNTLINNGRLGHQYDSNRLGGSDILDFDIAQTVKGFSPTYIWWNNTANSTPRGEDGRKMLLIAKQVTDALGAKMLIGTEEYGIGDNPALPFEYERTYRMFGEEYNIPYSMITLMSMNLYPQYPIYNGFKSSIHAGYRTAAPYLNHKAMADAIPIEQNIKLYKVRPPYKGGSPTVGDLVYDFNNERLRYFTAIDCGAADIKTYEQMDNLDGDRFAPNGETGPRGGTNEIAQWSLDEPVKFNKWALIEIISNKIKIQKASFTFRCSVKPEKLYIAVAKSTLSHDDNVAAGIWEDSPRTRWEEVLFTYSDGMVTVLVQRSEPDIQMYDKVRFLVNCTGEFLLSKTKFFDYNGFDKIVGKFEYKQRRCGRELLENTSVEEGWSLLGNASIQSFPKLIAVYTDYNKSNRHVELPDNNSSIKRTIAITQPCSMVVLRIVCQSYKKIITARFDSGIESKLLPTDKTADEYLNAFSSDEEKKKYISPTVDIKPFEYDYGSIRVIANGHSVQDKLVYQGWNELYLEIPVLNSDKNLEIEIKRNNWIEDKDNMPNSDNPILIHDISIQHIY